MALTKEQRDALPDAEFAVPENRQLPIHDVTHTKLAWDAVDNAKGLSDAQRHNAREKILLRAGELAINTSTWNQLKSVRFEAMAIDIPHVVDHPNRLPFSGILTRLDEPSDNPLGGSRGKCVVLPKDVAEKALPSLLGMAIDFTPDLKGHDARSKIGIITEATIEGNAIHIKGFFYASDFPDEVTKIQANKNSMGFSYEAQAHVRSMNDDPLIIDSCVFTGAAVLYKDSAAYTTTSLQAKAEILEKKMSEEITKMLSELTASIDKRFTALEQKQTEIAKARLSAGSILSMVKPHSDNLRAAADNMKAAGIGMHASRGHVAVLHAMADSMDSEASQGKMPHIYQGNDFYTASAQKVVVKDDSAAREIASLKEMIAGVSTQLSDVKKDRFHAAAQPERKTLDAGTLKVLNKVGLQAGEDKINVNALDTAFNKTTMTRIQKLAAKLNMSEAGQLAN